MHLEGGEIQSVVPKKPGASETAKATLATDSVIAISKLMDLIFVGPAVKAKLADFLRRGAEDDLTEAEIEEVVLEIWRKVRGVPKA